MSQATHDTFRTGSGLPPTADGRMRFTREAYQRMVETGVLTPDDPVELLDGEIVFMSPIGRNHLALTDKLNAFFAPRLTGRFICRVQGSIALSNTSEPEPDFLVLNHRDDFYRERDATPDDAALLIEVADSSLTKDSGLKLRLYAEAGITEYWLIDVARSCVIVHRAPDPAEKRFGEVSEHTAPATLAARAEGIAEHPLDLTWLFA